jgi:glycosyltransferase involved in cell wall biosynthesis
MIGHAAQTTRRKVLMIVQNLPVPFAQRNWQEAAELAANGYQVTIICPKGRGFEKRHEILNGIHIYRHPHYEAKRVREYFLEYPLSMFWEFLLACWVKIRHGFDVIHAINPPDDIFLIGGFFKFLFGTKFIFDHQDISPELYEAKFGRHDIFYRLMFFLEKMTYQMADVSLATNASYRKIAIERGKMSPENVFIVRSGPSLERMKIIPPVPTLKMGKRYLVGYVGVMGQQEGIQYLIEAARRIVYDLKRTDIHFTLVGGGPSLEDFKALTTEKNLDGYINFTGRAPEQVLLEVLNTADICVNPDEYNVMNDKSTMNKILEYMALGKPVVQFDLTEGRFSAGEASLYAKANDAIDFADKILELLDSPDRRAAMGAFGRARIEREFAWTYEAPKLLAAYDAAFTKGD